MTYEHALTIIRKPGHHSVCDVCLACDAVISAKRTGIDHEAAMRRATRLQWAFYEPMMIERAMGTEIPSNWEWRAGEFRPPLQAPIVSSTRPLGYSNASRCR
jgi:hypothetical protein